MVPALASCLLALASSPRIGMALNIPDGGGSDAYVSAMRDQIRMGVDGFVHSAKWSDIDKKGQLNLKPFVDTKGVLDLLDADCLTTISAIDTNQLALPGDLAGKPLNHPEVLNRWRAFVTAAVSSMGPRVKWVSLLNEADVRLAAHPEETAAALDLLKAGKEAVKQLRPDLQVSATLTLSGLMAHPQLSRRLLAEADFISLTYYAMDDSFQVKDPKGIEADLKAGLAFDPSRPVVFEEIGMAASPLLGGSEEKQAAFVSQCLRFAQAHPSRIPLMTYFLQVDFSPSLVQTLVAYYGLPDARFSAYLSTLGLKDSQGKPRLAWAAFRKELAQFKPF